MYILVPDQLEPLVIEIIAATTCMKFFAVMQEISSLMLMTYPRSVSIAEHVFSIAPVDSLDGRCQVPTLRSIDHFRFTT
ncbi:MAG: hypothetical protein LBH02_03480 [Methanocalculaceae archaeon]|jgi:hypothetical protein|nr:hypothetical protein [Methanocalculaceae archaeon]